MSECGQCAKLNARIEQLEDEIALFENEARLLEICEEYADLLAEQGRIPNTPAGKRGYIDGNVFAR